MNKLPISVAMPAYDIVRDVMTGHIAAEGIDITFLTFPVEEIFYRALVHREWDASELSFAKYAALRAQGDETFIGLPIFPSRMFRHGSLFIRRDGPIKAISDLKGRRVGVPEWAQTAAVYSRGLLAHQYGIDLRAIEWVQAGTNEVGRVEKVDLQLPDGLKLSRVPERSLNEMLLSGEIDAVLSARPPASFTAGHPNVRRFFENVEEVEAAYYRDTGIFPIMHVFALRRTVLDAHPWVARNLFKAFEEARRRSIERALDNTLPFFPIPWGPEHARRGMELLGPQYFAYGVEPNRKTLAAFLLYAFEQGVCKRHLSVEELFAPQMFGSYRV